MAERIDMGDGWTLDVDGADGETILRWADRGSPHSFAAVPPAALLPLILALVARLPAEAVAELAKATGERALRGHKRRADLDSRLGDALRASGINAADALAVQALYATAGQSGSHRIVSALRAVEAWLREGGAL